MCIFITYPLVRAQDNRRILSVLPTRPGHIGEKGCSVSKPCPHCSVRDMGEADGKEMTPCWVNYYIFGIQTPQVELCG